MLLNADPLISVPGWEQAGWDKKKIEKRGNFLKKLTIWERKLDIHFTEKIASRILFLDGMSDMDLSCIEDLPEWISWRELIGVRIILLDGGYLRASLCPDMRGRLLPAICLSLAISGAELLGGIGDELEIFLTPCDHALIVEELTGFAEPSDDKEFYACLEVLTKEQRNCIAEFIEFYFCMYKSSFPGFTERRRMASEELVKIWRGE